MKPAQGLLARWSRRKLRSSLQSEVERDLDKQRSLATDPANNRLPTDPVAQETGQEVEQASLTDADMPSIDSLNETSDFSSFMSPGVSDELRNLALRKLFSSPAFNVCDGLDEYDEDYTSFEKLGDIVTCDMKHQLEIQAQRQAEAMDEESGAVVNVGDEQEPEKSITRANQADKDGTPARNIGVQAQATTCPPPQNEHHTQSNNPAEQDSHDRKSS